MGGGRFTTCVAERTNEVSMSSAFDVNVNAVLSAAALR
jgi:hypothetical protein